MTENLPAPLVPPEVDLRDFKYMPLDIRRLLTSETWIDASEDPWLGHALLCLWCESWHQVPAASLPDNDRVLARLAMCDRKRWATIRDKALKGWIKCSDGLLYHPVVAEKALEAWESKRKQRARTKAASEARQRQRIETQADATSLRDDDRNGERDDQRHDDRNEQRDVHQGRGKGERRELIEKGEERETPSPSAKQYAFEGIVLRIDKRDYARWEKAFDTFPDLLAELTVIDGKFAAMTKPPDNPFIAASQWLRKEHERRVAEGAPRRNGSNGHDLASADEAQWRARLKGFIGGRAWLPQWGPPPLSDDCQCPAAVLLEFKNELDARAAA